MFCNNSAINALLAVYFFWPETAGRSLEQVDEIFLKSHSIFDPVKISKQLPPHSIHTADDARERGQEEDKESFVEVNGSSN